METLYFQNKPVHFSRHAVKRAVERRIAFPAHVYKVILAGKVYYFGKSMLKFVARSTKGSIVCVGEDTGSVILIRTIERGN